MVSMHRPDGSVQQQSLRRGLPLGQRALQVVERRAPSALVGADRLLVPKVAVREAHERDALGLLEVELDQLAHGIRVVVPEPREREAAWGIDLGVLPAAAVLLAGVGIA